MRAERPRSLVWERPYLRLLDQRLLPGRCEIITCRTPEEVADAIRSMVVRGAPAIGAAAAYGIAMAAYQLAEASGSAGPATTPTARLDAARTRADAGTAPLTGELRDASARASGVAPGAGSAGSAGSDVFWSGLEAVFALMRSTRPTAVNLFWAIERMRRRADALRPQGPRAVAVGLEAEAEAIAREDVETNRRIGRAGAELVPHGAGVLTHCNTGSLATVDYGTALGVIRAAHEAGKEIHVYAGETRPFLQGARLTAWELQQDGIPVTLITDGAAGALMAQGRVNLVIVGADRVTANGDVVNKIGTYSLAVLARAHGIPFYVAAPLSTVDPATPSGAEVAIEQRDPREVTHILGTPIAPEGVAVLNPAFDVTPAQFVTALITDKGVVRPPYPEALGRLFALERA